MASKYNWDKIFKDDEQIHQFAKWFWRSISKSNSLIQTLNDTSVRKGYIIKQEFRTYIYGVIIGSKMHQCEYVGENWKLCKIGMTHKGIIGDICGTRVDSVIKRVNKKCQKDIAKVLFELPVAVTDNRLGFKVENWVREMTGYPVTKELTGALGLPWTQEWALISHEYIIQLRKEIKRNGKQASTDVFYELKSVKDQHKFFPREIKNVLNAKKIQVMIRNGKLDFAASMCSGDNTQKHNQRKRNRDFEADNKHKVHTKKKWDKKTRNAEDNHFRRGKTTEIKKQYPPSTLRTGTDRAYSDNMALKKKGNKAGRANTLQRQYSYQQSKSKHNNKDKGQIKTPRASSGFNKHFKDQSTQTERRKKRRIKTD